VIIKLDYFVIKMYNVFNKILKGVKMFKSVFSRIKSQKGMSGVLIAVLLVVVGVGLVAGVKTYMDASMKTVEDKGDAAMTKATTGM
jgi:Flp pilus assembly pilin Flp